MAAGPPSNHTVKKPVNLALQGGGAHGAFTWGVLDWFRSEAGRHLVFEGVMTHFACADDPDDDLSSARQLSSFSDCLDTISACGLRPTLRHASNSANIRRSDEFWCETQWTRPIAIVCKKNMFGCTCRR